MVGFARKARAIPPLPKDLKKNVVESMTSPEIEHLLGPWHEALGSGVSYLVWYFDDNTCLTIFYPNTQHDADKQFFWLTCGPGEFTFDLLKQEREKMEDCAP